MYLIKKTSVRHILKKCPYGYTAYSQKKKWHLDSALDTTTNPDSDSGNISGYYLFSNWTGNKLGLPGNRGSQWILNVCYTDMLIWNSELFAYSSLK